MTQKQNKTKTENAIKDFALITYEPLTENDIIDLGITRWAFIKHDRDLFEDGTLKEPHYHYYIKIPNRKRISTLLNYFRNTRASNVLIEDTRNPNALIRYFVHYGEETKEQYNIDEIYSNFDINSAFTPNEDNEEVLTKITQLILNQEVKTFSEIVSYAIQINKLEVVTKNAYFFRTLISGR